MNFRPRAACGSLTEARTQPPLHCVAVPIRHTDQYAGRIRARGGKFAGQLDATLDVRASARQQIGRQLYSSFFSRAHSFRSTLVVGTLDRRNICNDRHVVGAHRVIK